MVLTASELVAAILRSKWIELVSVWNEMSSWSCAVTVLHACASLFFE